MQRCPTVCRTQFEVASNLQEGTNSLNANRAMIAAGQQPGPGRLPRHRCRVHSCKNLTATFNCAPKVGFLHFSAVTSPEQKGEEQGKSFFWVTWTCDGFLKQACVAGHPGLRDMGVHLNLRTLQGGMLNGRIYR